MSHIDLLSTLAASGERQRCKEVIRSYTGPEFNALDDDGMTVLHYMALCGHADLVRSILEHPQLPAANMKDRDGNTALHIAALHGHKEVCDLILDHTVTMASVTNKFEDTPADIAERSMNPAVRAAFEKHGQRKDGNSFTGHAFVN